MKFFKQQIDKIDKQMDIRHTQGIVLEYLNFLDDEVRFLCIFQNKVYGILFYNFNFFIFANRNGVFILDDP